MSAVAPTVDMASVIAPPGLAGAHVHVAEDAFGKVDGQPVQRFTLDNGQVSVQVITLGAIITAIRVPDREGKQADIVMGFDDPQGYLGKDNPYFGATVGRVANRIAGASFTLDGKVYQLHANAPNNVTLHGGLRGWDKALWKASRHADGVTFSLLSPDGDEGFPGEVLAQVTYRLTADNRLLVSYQAVATKPTPINIVNHSYFNLAGHCAGPEEVYRTRLGVNADRYTVLDQFQTPTGDVADVQGTPYDLRSHPLLGEVLAKADLDYNFVITRGSEQPRQMAYAAGAYHEASGRTLEVYTDQPGVQVYTSNGLPAVPQAPVVGKSGAKYLKHGAFCLETQNFPDAIHHVGRFPDSVLRPGSLYQHNMVIKFGVLAQQA